MLIHTGAFPTNNSVGYPSFYSRCSDVTHTDTAPQDAPCPSPIYNTQLPKVPDSTTPSTHPKA